MGLAELKAFFDGYGHGELVLPEKWRWVEEDNDPSKIVASLLHSAPQDEHAAILKNLAELETLFDRNGCPEAAHRINTVLQEQGLPTRRDAIIKGSKLLLGLYALLRTGPSDAAPRIVKRLCPRNNRRSLRSSTEYIILHTTETNFANAYSWLSAHCLANYIVDTDGTIYEIVEPERMANHAGRSMFNGRKNISEISVGIEIVGSYRTPFTPQQVTSVRDLVKWLKSKYRVSDKNVLIHPQVVYDFNKYEHRLTRGRRKDCIQAASPGMREKLGLHDRWAYDPDVKAGRVTFPNNDEGRWLSQAIYGIATSQEMAKQDLVRKTAPAAPEENEERFEGFLEIGDEHRTAWSIAGKEYNSQNTIYFLTSGMIRRGDQLSKAQLEALPRGTKALIGYIDGGHVKKGRSAFSIVGKRWNYPSTFYRLPDGRVLQGSELDDGIIPQNTRILFRN